MALIGDDLGAEIKTAVQAAAAANPGDPDSWFKALGNAVVAHIQANAVVTITSATATGVTAGGAAVPVTGTGTIS